MDSPVIQLMHQHGSVRNFAGDAIPVDMVEAIVAAAQRASTSSNLQVVSVVAVTAESARGQLATICGQEHVAQAPVVLVWCADCARLERACTLRGYRQDTRHVEIFLTGVLDVGIAAQSGALAAEALGLGVCYQGSIRNNTQAVIDLLQLPRLVFPVVGMALGRPAASPPHRPRLPLRAVLAWERYPVAPPDDALAEYDRAMIATGIYQGRQVPVPGKPSTTEDYGWLEHSARRMAQATRTELRAVLKRQGFDLD